MKRMKKLLSCILVFSILLSMAVIDVAAISTPASLMGKYVKLGTFDGNDMVWYVAARDNVNSDVDAISDYYLIAADAVFNGDIANVEEEIAAEGGTTSRAHNAWSQSSLRTFLNSNEDTVTYDTSYGVRIIDENYSNRKGFLTNFTTAEQSIMLPVTHQTIVSYRHTNWNAKLDADKYSGSVNWAWAGDIYDQAEESSEYFKQVCTYDQFSTLSMRYRYLDYYSNAADAYKEETTDKIFIPSMLDAYKYKLPLHDLVATNGSLMWFRDVANGRSAADSDYWLANAVFERQNTSRIRSTNPKESLQVRPCMFIDGSIKYNVTGDGTKENPYTLVWEKSCDDLVGKYVYLGEYGPTADEKYPIKWYVAGSKDVDNDGVEEYFLSASEIIDLKEMGTKGTSTHPASASAQWVSSALRAWLNSDEEQVTAYGKYVTYDTEAEETVYTETSNIAQVLTPTYSDEAGFLTNFTASEKALMKKVKHKSLMTIGGYKDSNIRSLGFTVNADDPNVTTPNYGGYFNMLENAGTYQVADGYNAVSNVVMDGTDANKIWQGVHSGKAVADKADDYFWIDALTNINGARGNNFGAVTFDSQAAYIESTDLVFVPSLFDVAEFGGEFLRGNKQNNNLNYGYQCGSEKPTGDNAHNYAGFMWLRDLTIAADNLNTGTLCAAYSPVAGPKAMSVEGTNIGVQPAMYISSEIVTSGLGTYAEPLTVVTADTADADGQVEITKNDVDGTITATAHIYNKTDAEKNFVVIIAKYVENEDGNLVLATANQNGTALTNADDPTTISASLEYAEGATYKAFIWDNTTIAPYSQAKSY